MWITLVSRVALACHPMDNGCLADQNIRQQHEQQQQDMLHFAMAQQDVPEGLPPMPTPVREVGSHGALVWSIDRSGAPSFSFATGHLHALEAEQAAVARCYHQGGRLCRVGLSWTNGVVAIVRGEDGSLYADLQGSRGKARASASTLCKQRSDSACKLVEVAASLNWYAYVE